MGALKPSQYKIIGMQKDNSESAFDNKYSFDNKNIRITSINDNSQLNIVNEKGTKIVNILNKTTNLYPDQHFIPNTNFLELRGIPIGYSILDNDLIIFTTENTLTPIDIINNNTILTISTLYGNVKSTQFLLNYTLKEIKNLTNEIKSGIRMEVDVDFITYLNPTVPIRSVMNTTLGSMSGLLSVNLPTQCAFIIVNIVKVFYNNQLLYKAFPGKLYKTSTTLGTQLEPITNITSTGLVLNLNDMSNVTNIPFPDYITNTQTITEGVSVLNTPTIMPLNVVNGTITRTANLGRGINYAFTNDLSYNTNYRYYQLNIDTELLDYIPLGYPLRLPNSYFGLVHYYQKNFILEPPVITTVTSIETTNLPGTVVLGNTYTFTATALPLDATNRKLSFSFDKIGIKLNYATVLETKPEDINKVIYSVSFTVKSLDDGKDTDIINLIITPESNTTISTLYPLTIIRPFLNVKTNSTVNIDKILFDTKGLLVSNYSNILNTYSNIKYTISKLSSFDWISTIPVLSSDIYNGIDKQLTISVSESSVNRTGYITVTPIDNLNITKPINFVIEQQGDSTINPTSIVINSDVIDNIAYGETFNLQAYIVPNNSNNSNLSISFDTSKVKLISKSIISNENSTNIYNYTLQITTTEIDRPLVFSFISDANSEITNSFSINVVKPVFNVYTLDNTNISRNIEFTELGELKSKYSNIVRIISNIKYNISMSEGLSSWISINKTLGNYNNNQDLLVTCLSRNFDLFRNGLLIIKPVNNSIITNNINVTIQQDSTTLIYPDDISLVLEKDKLSIVPLELSTIKAFISPDNSNSFDINLTGENIEVDTNIIVEDEYSKHTSVIQYKLQAVPTKQILTLTSVDNPSLFVDTIYQIEDPRLLITLDDKIPDIINFDAKGDSSILDSSIFNIDSNITYIFTSEIDWVSIIEIKKDTNTKYSGNINLVCEENTGEYRSGKIHFTSVYNNEIINQKIITIQQDGI